MISFANKKNIDELKNFWKLMFGDADFFVNLFFEKKFEPDKTLIFKDKGKIIATLFMNLYKFRFWGESVPCYYLSGLATLPEYRRRGVMSQLIKYSDEIMKQRNIPLAILIPSNSTIYNYYRKFDYEQVFAPNENSEIPFEKILTSNGDLHSAYKNFLQLFENKDFTIEKTFNDFCTIINDWELEGRPPKRDVAGMAKLINADFLFNIYKTKTKFNINLNISDSEDISLNNNELYVNLRNLCRLLFGFQIPTALSEFFPAHQPSLNLMLE